MATVKFKTTGAGKVISSIKSQSMRGRKTVSLSVGFAAPYAAYVHENLQAFHRVGQAKYLEQPMIQYQQEIARIIVYNLNNKESLETAVTRAGWFLLNEAKKLVPVDTGFLRDSGFVKVN